MFTEPLAAKIIKGEKTATRRRLSDKPRSPWYRNLAAGDRYPVGKVFTVNPGRGVTRVAECEVTARFRSMLGVLDDRIARQEGFDLMVDFRGGWSKINGGFDGSEVVDVVEFKLVGPTCLGCDGCGLPGFQARIDAGEPCDFCYGTGIVPTDRGRELVAKVAKEEAEASS